MLYKASAPGSLMLLGEYAVLYGKHALVCALDKRMTVTLVPRMDQLIKLDSVLGRYEASLSQLSIVPPFQYVLAALQVFKNKLTSGCDISIEADFAATIGFASSAAVAVATLAAVTAWLNISLTPVQMIQYGRKIVCQVQGLGSGADIAAAVMGGMVGYKATPLWVEKLPHLFPLTALYSGSKTPTGMAVKMVQQRFLTYPKLFKTLCHAIDQVAVRGVNAARESDWVLLGDVMNIQQGLLDSLGVNTKCLNDLIQKLRQQPDLLGAKISGSGLGDCVIGLGKTTQLPEQIAVMMSAEGVRCEKT